MNEVFRKHSDLIAETDQTGAPMIESNVYVTIYPCQMDFNEKWKMRGVKLFKRKHLKE